MSFLNSVIFCIIRYDYKQIERVAFIFLFVMPLTCHNPMIYYE